MDTTLRRSVWSWFSVAAIALLVIAFTAACGSDSENDDADAAATSVTDTAGDMATAASNGDTDAVATTAAGAADEVETATGGMVDGNDLGAIGTCFQENTTGDLVNDLRAGNTSTAEGVYRGCLEESLPAALVAQMDPIIEQATTCGETASKDLSDEDVAKIEAGDAATIQSLTQQTLTCVQDELGIPLS